MWWVHFSQHARVHRLFLLWTSNWSTAQTSDLFDMLYDHSPNANMHIITKMQFLKLAVKCHTPYWLTNVSAHTCCTPMTMMHFICLQHKQSLNLSTTFTYVCGDCCWHVMHSVFFFFFLLCDFFLPKLLFAFIFSHTCHEVYFTCILLQLYLYLIRSINIWLTKLLL